jgi:hypothetical protein
MAASATDLITDTRNAGRPVSTTVATARASGATTLACTALTYWPTASKVHFVTYQIDSNSNPVSGTQLDCEGIVVGNSVTSLVVNDGTDNGNSVGDIVEMLPTANWGQDLADALGTEHSRIGKHTAVTATSLVTTGNATIGGNAAVTGTLGVTSTSTFTGVATFTAAPVLPVDSVGNADLLRTAGDIGGAYLPWVPTWTNLTNGKFSLNQCRYSRIGKTIHFYITVALTSDAVTGSVSFTLPVSAYVGVPGQYIGQTIYTETGTGNNLGRVSCTSESGASLVYDSVYGSEIVPAALSSTAPFTWGDTDLIYIHGTYEAA